ncbi:MAG TPA: hypothetical protein DER09_06890 [Prolixibacteraceae bacterium]|nr:hypothetical protein [Prolixibacteraceae bacterium]
MKTINLLPLLLFAVFLWGCQEDAEIQPKDYPFIVTKDATQIDSTGVTFSAEILDFGKEEIIDFGFIWSGERGEYIHSLKETGNIKDFNFRLTSDLKDEEVLTYKAFIKTNANTVYANTIDFVSNGSKIPVIKDFYPKEGYDSTKVTIIGSNFSYKPENNLVMINGLEVKLIQSSFDTLSFIIPENNFYGAAEIVIQVGETKVVAKEKFLITGPVITDISVNEGYSGDFIFITGNNLYKRKEVSLFLGELKSSILEISDTKIKAVVPSRYYGDAYSEYKAKIIFTAEEKVVESNEDFLIKPSWKRKNGIGFTINNSEIVTYNNKAYLLEQFRPIMHQYDAATDLWETLVSSENPTKRHEKSLQIVIGDSLYFVGGNVDFVPSNKIWVFDFFQKKWYEKRNLPFSFIRATYFILENTVHVVTNDGRHWICDFANGKYVELSKFPEKFDEWSYFGYSFTSENRVFLVTIQNTFEYDKMNDSWTRIANNSFVNSSYNAPPVGFSYLGNGYVFYPSANSIFKFHPEEKLWVNTANYPEWVGDHARYSTFILNDMVYIEDLDDYYTNMVGYKNE